MLNRNQWYGYRPDTMDQRDHVYRPSTSKLPAHVDLRSEMPPVYDQGQLGSCTANAIAAALEFDQIKQGQEPFLPSRLFIYYNERVMEGTVTSDAGAEIRDGIKSVNQLGAPDEKLWPYSVAKFSRQPTKKAYVSAKLHLSLEYQRLSALLDMRHCLASGFPFVFGFTCYDSFESQAVARSGVLNMPKADEQVVGGHAVLCVGYDDKTKRFEVRNSWGKSWGDKGYFTIPYAYLTDRNLSDDFWKVTQVS